MFPWDKINKKMKLLCAVVNIFYKDTAHIRTVKNINNSNYFYYNLIIFINYIILLFLLSKTLFY